MIKPKLIPLLVATALMGASSTAHAETWDCEIFGATQKVTLTQESDPALSDDRYVPGTVTGPYGKKYTAKVSIDGFDRRWDYVTADKTKVYAIFMGPGGRAGFYDFTDKKEGELREPEHLLICENSKVKDSELDVRLEAEEDQHRLASMREAYILAIRKKVERNWIKPAGSGNMAVCEVTVVQGPGGIIFDVTFGTCRGSTAAYRASIENAVYKAEPLPRPGDPALFKRELTFVFSSE